MPLRSLIRLRTWVCPNIRWNVRCIWQSFNQALKNFWFSSTSMFGKIFDTFDWGLIFWPDPVIFYRNWWHCGRGRSDYPPIIPAAATKSCWAIPTGLQIQHNRRESASCMSQHFWCSHPFTMKATKELFVIYSPYWTKWKLLLLLNWPTFSLQC